jgi:hypothetical protein
LKTMLHQKLAALHFDSSPSDYYLFPNLKKHL